MKETLYRRTGLPAHEFMGESIWEYPLRALGLDTSEGIGIALVSVHETPLYRYDRTHQLYVVLSGGPEVAVEDRSYLLQWGDMLHIPPGLRRRARIRGIPETHLLVISTPPVSAADCHIEQAFAVPEPAGQKPDYRAVG